MCNHPMVILINNSLLVHFHTSIKIEAQWSDGKILNFNSGLLGVFSNIYSRSRFIENKFNWYEWWKNKTEHKQNKDHNVKLSMVCA